ncbi:MAG TPA: hypothetical protein VG734_06535 [Lacunisphaera sp.]|nr:hypothetical protein [Lacunisphaera sp.]
MVIRPAIPFLKPTPLPRPVPPVRLVATGLRPRPAPKSTPNPGFRLGQRGR